MRILIVEDEVTLNKTIAEIFECIFIIIIGKIFTSLLCIFLFDIKEINNNNNNNNNNDKKTAFRQLYFPS